MCVAEPTMKQSQAWDCSCTGLLFLHPLSQCHTMQQSCAWGKAILGGVVLALPCCFALCRSAGSRDNTVRVWDLTTLTCITTLTGHCDDVVALAISECSLLCTDEHLNL